MKRIISTLLSLFLVVLSLPAAAQHHNSSGTVIQAYPVAGLCISQIEGDYLKGFKKFGFTGGVGANVPLNSNQTWHLNLEACYSERGVREPSFDPDIPYRIFGFTLQYVDIPLMVYYRDPIGGVQIGAGISYSRLVQQPHGLVIMSPGFMMDTTDMSFLKNDLAVIGSVRFPLWRHLKLDIRCQYSLFPIKKHWTFIEHPQSALPVVTVNDCYNFSCSARILWVFGEPDHYKDKKKKK